MEDKIKKFAEELVEKIIAKYRSGEKLIIEAEVDKFAEKFELNPLELQKVVDTLLEGKDIKFASTKDAKILSESDNITFKQAAEKLGKTEPEVKQIYEGLLKQYGKEAEVNAEVQHNKIKVESIQDAIIEQAKESSDPKAIISRILNGWTWDTQEAKDAMIEYLYNKMTGNI